MDPSVEGSVDFPRGITLDYSAARAVFTNDAWIRNDLINGFEFLAFGQDTRNYSRGTRGELRLSREWDGPGWRVKPELGGRFEHLESVRAEPIVNSAPFTFLDYSDSLGRFRPNPPVQGGGIQSALAGVRLDWDSAAIETRLRVGVEVAHQSSTAVGIPVTDPFFGQLTLDGDVNFPTFGRQSLHVYAHVVATTGGDTPLQRWAYLGGPGTLPTIDLLSLGGDQLVYIDAHYAIPIRRWTHPRPRLPVVRASRGPRRRGVPGVPEARATERSAAGPGLSLRRVARRSGPPHVEILRRALACSLSRVPVGGPIESIYI